MKSICVILQNKQIRKLHIVGVIIKEFVGLRLEQVMKGGQIVNGQTYNIEP
jgi:hypothetical protein